jgi:SAM-dependent methyltransferase
MGKLDMVRDGHLGGYVRGGDPGTWCPHLWTWVVQTFGIRSVLDVGCGEGHASRFFRGQGCDIRGVDGCERAIAESVIPGHAVQHDFCTGPFLTDQAFDLVWSCEFLEHVEERFVPNILRTFSQARKVLLVTHAFPGDTDGHHHVNCRRSSYWIRRIEAAGFRCDARASLAARKVALRDYHRPNHFARSGLVFRPVPSEKAPAGAVAHFMHWLNAEYKSFVMGRGLRWSAAYREHRRLRRAAKRERLQVKA